MDSYMITLRVISPDQGGIKESEGPSLCCITPSMIMHRLKVTTDSLLHPDYYCTAIAFHWG